MTEGRGPPWARPGRGPGFRPPWWPEDEPFPGRGGWARGRRHFMRRVALAFVLFFALTFAASALAVGLGFRAFHLANRPGAAVAVTVLGFLFLAGLARAGARAVRRTAAPIGDVMDAARRLEDGDYSARVRVRGTADVRRLAAAFNAMAERLEENERRRRELFADLAHELRTPLTVIQGHAEGILDGLYPPDPERLEKVLAQTSVMARLLDDLQTLSKAESGALRLDRERLPPGALVEEAVRAFGAQADARGIALRSRLPGGLPDVEVDRTRIGEVLSNLVANALRHTPSGGSVTVEAERSGGGVAFAVTDTGSGIPQEQLAHVFERFARSPDSEGSGLGLAIAKGLVEAHGGTIEARSHPGEGATVTFDLPSPSVD